MLKFIVLGLVPGTNFQISFGWLLILASLFIVAIVIIAELVLFPANHQEQPKKKTGQKGRRETIQTA